MQSPIRKLKEKYKWPRSIYRENAGIQRVASGRVSSAQVCSEVAT